MRRAIALTLLALFGYVLIAPFLAPGAAASLPPCCRRHGKHHCSMMQPLTGSQRGLQTIQEKCPYQSAHRGAAHSAGWRPQADAAFYASIAIERTRPAQSATLFESRFQRGPPRRGPPSLFA
jgi:ribosome modulation factor